MSCKYQIVLPLKGMACPRPRVTKNGFTFMPKTYREFQKTFKIEVIASGGIPKFENNVLLDLIFEFDCIAKNSRVSSRKNPDIDNLAKSVMDSLTGMAWDDDAVVSELHCKKVMGNKNQISISIEEI